MLNVMVIILFVGLMTAAICWSVLTERKEGTRHAEMEQIDQEYREAVDPEASRATRYEMFPCPHCGHYRLRPIDQSGDGLPEASAGAGEEGRSFRCEHCGKTWRQSN